MNIKKINRNISRCTRKAAKKAMRTTNGAIKMIGNGVNTAGTIGGKAAKATIDTALTVTAVPVVAGVETAGFVAKTVETGVQNAAALTACAILAPGLLVAMANELD